MEATNKKTSLGKLTIDLNLTEQINELDKFQEKIKETIKLLEELHKKAELEGRVPERQIVELSIPKVILSVTDAEKLKKKIHRTIKGMTVEIGND